MEQTAKKIHFTITQGRKIVIIPHQHPDGDAIGAATAFHEYLSALGKEGIIFCTTAVTEKLNFVPHSNNVTHDTEVFKDKTVDIIIVLDSGDLRYAGVDVFLKNHHATIINIDHHATNEQYGHINLVIPTAASTTEILFHYFKHNNIRLNEKMATSLLTGLTTDTGNFTNAATSAVALRVGSELVRAGANLKLITNATVRNKSLDTLRLWGKALGRLTQDEQTGIAHTYITQQDLIEHQVGDNESEGIANFLNTLDNTPIALILKETNDGKVKGSFRTTRDDIDVSLLAQKMGGGGHKKAAGFSADGTIDEVLKKIFATASHS